jgi:hypothetical protein
VDEKPLLRFTHELVISTEAKRSGEICGSAPVVANSLCSSRPKPTRISNFAALKTVGTNAALRREPHALDRSRNARHEIRGSGEERDLRFLPEILKCALIGLRLQLESTTLFTIHWSLV